MFCGLQVRVIESMSGMSEETYEIHCSERTWSVTLSDGTSKDLKPGGSETSVSYEDRLEYSRLAKEARMSESDQQVSLWCLY